MIWCCQSRDPRCENHWLRASQSPCTGIPHCLALHRYIILYTLMVCGNPESDQVYWCQFPTAFTHFLSLCPIFIILIFELFHYYYIFYGDLWSVVFEVTIVIALGCHEPHPYKRVNLKLINVLCSDWPANQLFLHLSPSPLASLFCETQQYWN